MPAHGSRARPCACTDRLHCTRPDARPRSLTWMTLRLTCGETYWPATRLLFLRLRLLPLWLPPPSQCIPALATVTSPTARVLAMPSQPAAAPKLACTCCGSGSGVSAAPATVRGLQTCTA